MTMYNKIFTKILDSSVWLEPTPTRIVWITMIAAMDENGFCQFAAVGNVAGRARVTEAEARAAIKALESPDLESSDQDNEGRCIERVPGGWMVLNAPKYRAIVTRVNAQEKTKERVRRFREKNKPSGNGDVTERNDSVTPSEAEAEAEPKTEGKRKKIPPLKENLLLRRLEADTSTRVAPDSGSEVGLANWLCEEAGVVGGNATRIIAADAIRMLAKEGGTTQTAAQYILDAAKAAKLSGQVVNRWWFEDQRYRPQHVKDAPPNPGVYRGPSAVDEQARKDKLAEDYAMWCSMSPKYREQHKWIGEVPA